MLGHSQLPTTVLLRARLSEADAVKRDLNSWMSLFLFTPVCLLVSPSECMYASTNSPKTACFPPFQHTATTRNHARPPSHAHAWASSHARIAASLRPAYRHSHARRAHPSVCAASTSPIRVSRAELEWWRVGTRQSLGAWAWMRMQPTFPRACHCSCIFPQTPCGSIACCRRQ